jgi:hypothetical protein
VEGLGGMVGYCRRILWVNVSVGWVKDIGGEYCSRISLEDCGGMAGVKGFYTGEARASNG